MGMSAPLTSNSGSIAGAVCFSSSNPLVGPPGKGGKRCIACDTRSLPGLKISAKTPCSHGKRGIPMPMVAMLCSNLALSKWAASDAENSSLSPRGNSSSSLMSAMAPQCPKKHRKSKGVTHPPHHLSWDVKIKTYKIASSFISQLLMKLRFRK